MKPNRFIFCIVMMLLVSASVNAQQQLSFEEQLNLKERVQKRSSDTQTIISDFIQTKYIDVLEEPVVSKGRMLFEAPDKILWSYTAPSPHTVIIKANKLFVTQKEEKDEINLASNKLFKSFSDLIVNSVKGDLFDEEQFEITYYKVENGYRVLFKPKDKRILRFMAGFELTFAESNADVEQVKLIEPNSDYTLIVFKNRKTNTTIPPNTFQD